MSSSPGNAALLQNAPARRAWYQLEDRHSAMARGRAAGIAGLAAVAACAGAIAVHAFLA